MSNQWHVDGDGDTPSVYVISDNIPGILYPVLAFMLCQGPLQARRGSEENCKKGMRSGKCASS